MSKKLAYSAAIAATLVIATVFTASAAVRISASALTVYRTNSSQCAVSAKASGVLKNTLYYVELVFYDSNGIGVVDTNGNLFKVTSLPFLSNSRGVVQFDFLIYDRAGLAVLYPDIVNVAFNVHQYSNSLKLGDAFKPNKCI